MTVQRTEANSIRQICSWRGGTVCITQAHMNFLSEEIVLFVSGSKVNDKKERSHNLPKAKVLILLKCKNNSEGKKKMSVQQGIRA